MRILIPLFSPPTGTWGSLTRVLAIHSAAKDRGHVVAFAASGALADRLEKLGCQVYRTPEATLLGLPRPISRWLCRRSQNVIPPVRPGRSVGSIWLVLWFTGISNQKYLCRLVDAELTAAEEFSADVLFTEVDPGAFVVSRITGIPIACTYASVMNSGIDSYPWRCLRDAQARILQDYGLKPAEPQEIIQDKQTLKIIPSIPSLEKDLPPGDDVIYVGSLLHNFRTATEQPFQPDPGKRYIFVYVGTGSIELWKLREVLPRIFPEDSSWLCLVGSQGVQREERCGNVIFRPYWDAYGLIPHCDWVICHGGHNTIIQSLLNGVPLLIFPGAIFERRFNAQMVEIAGAGRFCELPQFNEEWLANAMLGRDLHAARALELGNKIKALGGAAAAVKAIERLGATPL